MGIKFDDNFVEVHGQTTINLWLLPKDCQMLLWWMTTFPYSINICDIAAEMAQLYSVYQLLSAAPCLNKANSSGLQFHRLFVLELASIASQAL